MHLYQLPTSLFISTRRYGLILIGNSKLSFNKYYRRQTKENWLNYTLERNKATKLGDETRMSFERKICANIKENPKTLWQYVKAKKYETE